MRKNDIEKSLKRFLKRKVSYSLSLLIAFMITGGISFGAGITTEEIQETKGDLLTKIQTEREEIKRKIAENERLIGEYNSDFVELVRKGDFYSKPLIPSTQVFFSYQYLDNGKMKDRTEKEFKETIDAVNKHYGTTSGESLLKSIGNVGKDKVMAGNGVVVDNEVFRETIEVGANIKPVEPELPSINPNVSVNVSAPVVSLGALPGTVSPTMPSISTVTAPVVAPPTAPGNLSVNVSTPLAVDKITVTPPSIPTITAPAEKSIEVSTPTAPGGFEPTTVTAPTAPSIPVIVPPTIPSFASNVVSGGNGTSNAVDNRSLSNGVIEMVAIKSGDFNLKRTGNTWTYSYSNYSGMNAWAVGSATWDGNTDVTAGSSWANGSRSNATSSGSQLGFQKLVGDGSTQSTMLSNATFLYSRGMETSTDNLGEFVHLDVHGAASVDTQRDGLDKATNGLGNKTEILNAYDDAGKINWSGRTSTTSNRHTWINSGKLVIEGGNTSVTNNYDHHNNSNAKAIVINTGDIIFQPYFNGTNYYQKYTSAFVMSLDGTAVHHIMYNGPTGSIKTYTQTASIFLSGSSSSGRPLSIVNRGTLEMYGENSAGIYLKTGSNNDLYFTTENFAFNSTTNTVTTGSYKPLKLFGDSSIGLYGEATEGTTIGNFAVDIGEAGKGNQNFTTSTDSGTTNGTNLVDHDINSSGLKTNIEKSFGIIANAAMNLTSHQIRIYDKTEDSVGVYPNADITLNIGGGEISLNGGSGNIAVLINGKGSVTSTGNVSVTGGVKNMAVYVKGGTSGPAETVSVNKITATNTKDSVVVYGENGAKIIANELNVVSKIGDNPTAADKNDTGAAFAKGAGTTITITRVSPAIEANINITGAKLTDADRYVGFGLMAAEGGVINAKNNYIKVTDGSTAAASIGTNSNIDLSGGTVEFDGSGYAVYSDGAGKINLSNSNIILKGKSTAFDLTLGATSPITLDQNSRIHVKSNDVVVFNLKNATGLNTNNLEVSITNALGSALGGTSLSDLIVSEAEIDKYKTAAVDGGTIIIGNLDKTGTGAADETQEQKDGNFYYNRFLGQRLVATATNSTVSAVLNNTQASKFNNQVVGLEMNSSKLAASNAEAGINLVNSTIIADRDGAGAGAIGAFINYGVVNIDGTSLIKVEKENNTVNDKAVGIYAVNGSKVSNNGDIEVGGKESIGILGMAYRETVDGTVVVAEYGSSAQDQGKIDITNSKNITLDGEGSIGIYAYNNNPSGANANVSNTANITVGNSGDSAAIGIYGKKAKISNTGNITVGNGGVAIYATKESEITNLGTLNLSSNGIGVIIDGTSTIATTVTNIVLNSVGEADTSGKTGIFYKGDSGTESQTIGVAVNASALDKGTAIYVENMNVTSSGTLNVGKEGVGIFVKGNSTQTGTNTGNIDLTSGKTGAVGMYTKTANILNGTGGVINVNDVSQIGMYAEGAGSKATNKGKINLNVDKTIGIYVKSGAVTELDVGNTIVFNGKSSVGVFAENAAVKFKDNLTFKNNNENKNIYIYGKGTTVGIEAGKVVTVDGGTLTTTGNKTVGIYLQNEGTGSTFTSNTTEQLNVVNGAIGIYSKGNNTLNVNANVTAAGEKTTGVFIEDGSTIAGTVTIVGASGVGAVGVYGSGGAVTIGAGELALNTNTDEGTGMYLTDGAYASGGKITVNNTAAAENIGVYYSKGTALKTVTNESEIELTGNKSIGIYAADGINLVNTKNITSTGLNNNIASYVGENSALTSNGDITMAGTDNIGIYTGKGRGVNNGTINLIGATGTSSAGMVAKTDAPSDTASIENTSTITVGNNLGMYIKGDGTSSGKNTGSIVAAGGTGVYVDGGGNSFDGAGGSITSNAVGIYLKDTDANKITTGTLNIGSGGVGVFGENAKIDFAVNVAGTGAIGVTAKSGTVISRNITTGQGSVGAYVLDNTVSFNDVDITTGTNSTNSSIGILLNSAVGTYTMSNVNVSAQDGVGIYLDGTTPGINLTHNGTINTAGGIGIYVDAGTTLTTGISKFNINGGTGVYIDGGTANLGTTGNLTFNFLAGGIGIYNNGGTLNLGNNIIATGPGSIATTANGDLNSSGNLNISSGGTGFLGIYDNGTTTAKSISNTGNITAVSGGIGLAATKGTSDPTGAITINNGGTITASGKVSISPFAPSIGIYTDIANIVNTGNISVGSSGIGIYSNYNGVLTSVQNDNMKITGTDGIGVYLKGATSGIVSNNITSTGGTGNTGLVLDGVNLVNINAGSITLGDESVGILTTNGTASLIDGIISIGASSDTKSAVGIVVNAGSNVTVAGSATITTGNRGIGVYSDGAGTAVTVANAGNISVGTDGIYMYSKGAALTFTGDITADNQIGIVADSGSVTANGSSTITVKNGGIGAYIKNAAPSFTGLSIVVQAGIAETSSNQAKYSVGVYYEAAGNIGTLPTVTQTGSYTIGTVLNKSTGTTAVGINIGTSGSNQVGVMVKGGSTLNVTSGGIAVGNGDSNIGIYGENSTINVTGNILVGTASSLKNSSIGVSLKGGSYTGTTGNLLVGSNSIGIYGTTMTENISQSGTTMTVGDNGVGIYGSGTGNINLNMATIGLGNNNSIGIYAKGMNASITGDIGVGTNTSIGIVSEGNGNVTYTGDMTIADKGTNKGDTGSVGIYKLNGTGTITTTSMNNWTVGNNGYGIFVKQEKEQIATINNGADMNLGTAAVGIYSSGANIINNTGNIIVGATDVKGDHDKVENHLNSIGIYATWGTAVSNSGNITVNYDHSVGMYGEGTETKIKNTGTISVDGGGVGILVRDGAVAVNAVGGNIVLGSTLAPDPCTATTVGMAAYSGARIENAGTITINEGVGMLIGQGATFANSGTIYLKNGIGIEGPGAVNNYGNIIIISGGSGTPGANVGLSNAEVGSVKIESNGTITINDKYVSIGGTLSTAGNIVVNGALVDVTTGTPLFNANSVSGEVRILPNFATTGNGISYEIEGFVNTAMGTITGNKLTPVTSPLFIAKVTDNGNLVIAKRPYADITVGEQFDALDKGLDNILKNSGGVGKDADILKGLNKYLEGLPSDQFEREASTKLAETRGDIYATIQGRMQDINRAFDNSFYELESSYNLTKDSSKYSVIYTDGNYKDSTLGIDDYDYKVMGLLYMKEKEGTEYGSKYGYTLGFTGSKFDFDDGGSKEDVYSLRVGTHRVKNLSEEHKVSWLSRIELGYNRHIAKRKLNLQETYENKGEYNTYSVALNNRLTKVIYTDLSRQLDVYADLDLEYGKVDDFKESAGSKGGLEVQIKDNDYLSAQVGAGVKASQRIYAGNDISVKVTADVKYAYEFGDNYDGNKARLKNGEEGYYSLITPEEREGKLTGKAGLTVEKANHMGVTFEVEAADEGSRKGSSIKYGMRFNYKF
ncbi:autotransporter-associated N-terminal domain-containing protein [Fusobacterium sp. THCT1E1]